MAATEAGAALAADGVDLVDEDDRLAHLACLLEEVAHAAGADADEHLHEVGAGDGQEADTGLARDGPREQCLAGPGRPDEQDALRDARTDLLEALRHAQEVDDLLDLQLHAVVAGDVGERGGGLVGLVRLGLAAADRHDVALLAHGAPLHPHEERDDEEERQQDRHEAGEPVRLGRLVVVVDPALLQELLVGVAQLHRTGGRELAAVGERAGDGVGGVVQGDLLDLARPHLLEELGVGEPLAGVGGEHLAADAEGEHGGDDRPHGPARQWGAAVPVLRVLAGAAGAAGLETLERLARRRVSRGRRRGRQVAHGVMLRRRCPQVSRRMVCQSSLLPSRDGATGAASPGSVSP